MSDCELNDVCVDLLAGDLQMGQADGQRKSPRAGAAGIDVKNAATVFDRWFVGVAAYYYVKAGSGWADVDLFDVVQHVY